jgi:uncharacterized membrane protein
MLASHIGLYEWLKALHVVMAVVWVGGNVVLQILAVRLVRGGDVVRMAALAGDVEWLGMRVFAPASGLVLILGVWMVVQNDAWNFGQLWVLVAIAMFAYSFLSGLLYLGPSSGRLKRLYESEGPAGPAASALLRRIFLVSRVELVLLILIVFDMVLKPGL